MCAFILGKKLKLIKGFQALRTLGLKSWDGIVLMGFEGAHFIGGSIVTYIISG